MVQGIITWLVVERNPFEDLRPSKLESFPPGIRGATSKNM